MYVLTAIFLLLLSNRLQVDDVFHIRQEQGRTKWRMGDVSKREDRE